MFRTAFTLLLLPCSTVLLSILTLVTLPFDRRERWFDRWCHLWGKLWLWSAGVRLRIEGGEHFPGPDDAPVSLAGNHRSLLDTPILEIATRGRMRWIAKGSYRSMPLAGWLLAHYGMVFLYPGNRRKSVAELDRMVRRLQDGRAPLVVFPEGTRSRTGKLGPFHRGTFQVIKRAGVALVPFVIIGSGDLMPPGTLRVRPGEVVMRFGEPIPAEDVQRLSRDELLARTRAYVLRNVPEQTPEDEYDRAASGTASLPEAESPRHATRATATKAARGDEA